MTTSFLTKEDGFNNRKWLVVDAAGVPVGRLATEVATIIRGKHRPDFTRHVDGGDFVVVVNASQVKLTGNKASGKFYYRHSEFMGGLKAVSAGEMMEKHPDRVIRSAVKGMLPRGPLGNQLINKLKIYPGPDHPHKAQCPVKHEVSGAKAA